MLRLITLVLIFVIATGCTKSITKEIIPEPEYETQPPGLSPVTVNINGAIGGYYVGLPYKYNNAAKRYPLLIFIHGGGQFGNGGIDLPILLNEGIPQLYDEKVFPPDFPTREAHYSFIMLAPQLRRNPSNEEIYSFINYALENYRADSSRIYLTGMSNGGRIACNVAAAYPSLFAAIVPMAGVPDSLQLDEKTSRMAESKLPIWIFHNESDEVIDIKLPMRFVASMDRFNPAIPPRLTDFQQPMGLLGHDAWTRATNPGYRENNMNIYEWMLSYHR